MQIGDFSIFVFLPVLLVPLALTYMSLRRFGWYRDRLFLDAWVVFIVLFCTAIFNLIFLRISADALNIYWSIPEALWVFFNFFGTFILSATGVGCLLSLKSRSRKHSEYSLLPDKDYGSSSEPGIARISILTTIVVLGVSIFVFLGIVATAKIYDHFNPRPEIQYGIYDI